MTGEERLASEIRDFFLSETDLTHPGPNPFGLESPIERLLLCAVVLGCRIGATWFTPRISAPDENSDLQFEAQAQIEEFRVDFLFTVVSEDGILSRLVVECDGHDFHERTKEQAARDRSRDRALQQAGFTVFRFTGSEIYRGPLKCARQIFQWAEDAAWKKKGE
jgi:very-short-patch-repair endonuclease